MMRQIIILLFLFLPAWLFSQAHYTFMYEKGFSAHSGAENLIAANYIYGTVDKNYIPTNIFKEKRTVGKLGNMAYRFAKFWYVDFALNGWGFVTQHEYFGHTVRAKQSGYNDAYPTIGVPYFRKKNTVTYRGERTGISTPYERKLISAGGTEANNILARRLFAKTLLDNKTLYEQSMLFFGNNTYQSLTLLFAENVYDIGDIESYNVYIVHNGNKEKVQRQYKTLALIELLTDPMNYFSLFSIFKNYVYEGKHLTKIPMLRIGDKVRYLPNFRFILAPYSPEVVYENYVKINAKLLYVNFRHATMTSHSSFGISAYLYNYKITNRIVFDTKLSYWEQPSFPVYNDSNEKLVLNEKGYGLALINVIHYKFFDKYGLSLTAEAGYKTGGYLEGEMLDPGLILRGGLSFKFD